MIPVYNTLLAIASLLHSLITIFIILFVVRAVISWFSPDPANILVRFVHSCTEPILVKIRNKIPRAGMLDLSVLAVILLLYFIQIALVQSLREYAEISKMSYMSEQVRNRNN